MEDQFRLTHSIQKTSAISQLLNNLAVVAVLLGMAQVIDPQLAMGPSGKGVGDFPNTSEVGVASLILLRINCKKCQEWCWDTYSKVPISTSVPKSKINYMTTNSVSHARVARAV